MSSLFWISNCDKLGEILKQSWGVLECKVLVGDFTADSILGIGGLADSLSGLIILLSPCCMTDNDNWNQHFNKNYSQHFV